MSFPVFLSLLVATAMESGSYPSITQVPSPNFNNRLDKSTGQIVTKPTILVLHYTVSDLNRTFDIFRSNSSEVSSHYTVAEDGRVYQHVDEKYRAWHAGQSWWGEIKDVNTYSVGIEIVNAGFKQNVSQPPGVLVDGSTYEWYPYPASQMRAVIDLSKDIVRRYEIAPRNVVGHSDVAPGRKEDPGPLFPWASLASEGVGAWINASKSAERTNSSGGHNDTIIMVQKKLHQYGYTNVSLSGVMDQGTKDVLISFQMHFRPSNIGGKIDRETEDILDALLDKFSH